MTVSQPKYRCTTDGNHLSIVNADSNCQRLDISFKRTIRVPDNVEISTLPPELGTFPLYKVKDFASRLHPDLAARGGVFLPMYRASYSPSKPP